MKSTAVAVSLALAALAPFAAGCGTVDYDREAEYPQQQAVGYTPPQTAAAVALPTPPQPQQVPQQEGEGAQDPNAIAEVQQQADTAIGQTGDEYADTDPAALSDFRTTLDPYGSWVEDGTYGTVWVPSTSVVGSDFSPYVSAGHWTYDTDYVWVSDYSWGWAPFHYGRWTYIGGRGWGWIPGRTYAGAWVTWRTGYDDWGYVGWAPLPPTYYWHRGYAYGISVRPYAPYAFCGHGDLFYRGAGGLHGRLVTGSQVGVVAGHTRPYVPASPTVGAGGHVGARPTVASGPSPSSMGIPNHAVTPPPAGDRGLTQAQAYSHASTAAAYGARPPAQSMAHNGPSTGTGGTTGGQRPNAATSQPYARGTTPQTGSAYAHGTAPQTGSTYSHTPPTSGYRPSTPGYRPPATASAHPAPTYRAPSYSPAPHYGPTPSYGSSSTPHYGPSPSAGSHYSAPSTGTYHAPSGGSTSRPSSGGGYHPSGGGGSSYHGGGGGGGRGGRR